MTGLLDSVALTHRRERPHRRRTDGRTEPTRQAGALPDVPREVAGVPGRLRRQRLRDAVSRVPSGDGPLYLSLALHLTAVDEMGRPVLRVVDFEDREALVVVVEPVHDALA